LTVTHFRLEPIVGNRQRAAVDVVYGDGSREEIWFDLPEELPASRTGNPWLALMLPLAAASGEDLRLDLPVDSWLKLNAEALVKLWTAWHPETCRNIRILAETTPPAAPQPDVLSTFTAGIDSFFTVLRHPECRHYINVLGLDMPLFKRDAYERLTARLERIAGQLGARLIRMATNVRETRWGRLPWESYAAGGVLSASMLLLETRFGAGLIPSAIDIRVPYPSATHPLTTPLYSASTMRIFYDGSSHSRAEKIEALAGERIVLDNLHVCFVGQDTHGQDDANCSRCGKCLRTMLALDALGKLRECPMFDLSGYSVELAGRMECVRPTTRYYVQDVRQLAERYGRQDIVRQLDLSLRRSRRAALLDRFLATPFLWRLPYYYRKYAFRGLAKLHRISQPVPA